MKINQLRTLIKEIITQTMQQLNEVERGEWWIYPGGDAQFADGEVGDSGHEGYVIEHLAREIYEHFTGSDPGDMMGYLSEYEDELLRNLTADGRMDEKSVELWNSSGPTEVLIEKLLEDKVYKDPEQANFAVYVAWGSSSKDARVYAMKYLGWKRMTTSGYGTTFQTWFIRPSDLTDMQRGLGSAWSWDGDEDEEQNSKHEVEIEVMSNQRMFHNIPLAEFERASVRQLIPYLRRSLMMRELGVAPVKRLS